MKQKELFVTSPGLPPFEEYVDEIKSLWETKTLTHQGEKYRILESRIAERFGTKFAPLFANGHLALQVLLRAYGWRDGEVITTPFTFASTTMAIIECGLTPVFCDIDPISLTIDADKIEGLITPKTRAILGVHVYGVPCDVDKIQAIANNHNLKVIYDAAHAFGEKYRGVDIARYGDSSMFSFHATKVFNSVEGGALALSNKNLYEAACNIRQFGAYGDNTNVQFVGTNAKMTEMHAAMGLCNLRHLDEYIEKRRAVYDEYSKYFDFNEDYQTIAYPDELKPNYAYYPVIVSEASRLSCETTANALKEYGIFAKRYFHPLTNEFEIVKAKYCAGDTPVAKSISDRVLCLPMHPNMDVNDSKRIVELIDSLS